ncbi:MAG: hypothetical protein BAJALOKI1v1_150012 [Promethearchaeota archaeon]|nr:MAG: hypothetical protein BAJALOKI1v1_150012 [Candidatus Lokiarchaeota archaeon]
MRSGISSYARHRRSCFNLHVEAMFFATFDGTYSNYKFSVVSIFMLKLCSLLLTILIAYIRIIIRGFNLHVEAMFFATVAIENSYSQRILKFQSSC